MILFQPLVYFALLIFGAVGHSMVVSPKTVVVAGATGRTGRLVCSELLTNRPNTTIRAFVRDVQKAKDVLPDSPCLEIVRGDIDSLSDINSVCTGADCTIWCATGFSDESTFINRMRGLLGIALLSRRSIDLLGIERFAKAMSVNRKEVDKSPVEQCPQVIMLSSAGVTRPAWAEEKKANFPASADIPIVRLNPFGILGKKFEAEQLLRESGTPYAVLRPCGLNDDWPQGRPVLSQGDVAVGRTSRGDVAAVLAQLVDEPASCGKTFEMFTLKGYPPPRSLAPALCRLTPDRASEDPMPLTEEAIAAQYAILQQLLPGEVQDPTALEMGRTYEQLDEGSIDARAPRAEATAREKNIALNVR